MNFDDAGFDRATLGVRNVLKGGWIQIYLAYFFRYAGFLLLGLVGYAHLVYNEINPSGSVVYVWMCAYLTYLLILEYLRLKNRELFDSTKLVVSRILTLVLFLSWLFSIVIFMRSIFVFSYLLPLVMTIVYFPSNQKLLFSILTASLIGMMLGPFFSSEITSLSIVELIISSIILVVLLILIQRVYVRTMSLSGSIANILKKLKGTLEVTDVVEEIAEGVSMITKADGLFILIVDPDDHSYITHKVLGLNLSPTFQMGELIDKCNAIQNGEPYEKDDLAGTKDEAHFQQFFSPPPRTILVIPIFGKKLSVLGLVMVGSYNPIQPDDLNRKSFRDFINSVSVAVEASLLYRNARLSLMNHKSAADELLEVDNEVEIEKILVMQAMSQIRSADGCILHRYEQDTGYLIPVAGFRSSPDGNFKYWKATQANNRNPVSTIRMKLGDGVAGLALKKKDIVVVSDAKKNPIYIKYNHSTNIDSLMSAPLVNPINNNFLGALSLYCEKKVLFTTEDQSTLLALANQGALSLAKARESEELKLRGNVLKEIFESALEIDFKTNESTVAQQLAEIARRVLPFSMVRIRLFDVVSQELVSIAAAGYPEADSQKLIGARLPLAELEKFLISTYSHERSYLIPSNANGWGEFAEKYLYITQKSDESSTWEKYDAFFTPLISENGDLIGFISWDQPENHHIPSVGIINAVGAFASMAGWSIDLTRAYKRISEQQSLIRNFIAYTTERLETTKNKNIVGDVAVDLGRERLNTEACSLYRVYGNEIGLTNSTYLKNTTLLNRRKPLRAEMKGGLSSWVAATKQPLYFNSESAYMNHPGWGGNIEHLVYMPSGKCANLLLVPILGLGDKCLGVLSFENKMRAGKIANFSSDDVQEAINLADELGLSLRLAEQLNNARELDDEMLEDDLHELKNKFYYGVQGVSDTASYWLQQKSYKKVREQLEVITENSVTILDELYNLHNSVKRKYYEIDDFQQALELLVESFLRTFPSKDLTYEDNKTRINVVYPTGMKLAPLLRYIFIRIASGALMNAIKHSGFLDDEEIIVNLTVFQDIEYVTMKIQDNGRGIKNLKPGYGIQRMQDLVRSMKSKGIDIKLFIDSSEEYGTTVSLVAGLASLEVKNDKEEN